MALTEVFDLVRPANSPSAGDTNDSKFGASVDRADRAGRSFIITAHALTSPRHLCDRRRADRPGRRTSYSSDSSFRSSPGTITRPRLSRHRKATCW